MLGNHYKNFLTLFKRCVCGGVGQTHVKGRITVPNRMNFESSKGGEGVISSPKNYVADFGSFSSSDLVSPSFPKYRTGHIWGYLT